MKQLFSKISLGAMLFALSSAEAAQAAQTLCSIEAAPAATLLLPYFEVDLRRDNGVNTVFTVNNASNRAVLAHVTLWSDLSVPTFDFNIYLTGYDAEVIDLRQLFVNGFIPANASDGQDPVDTISPQGAYSQDLDFTSCQGQLPLPAVPVFLLSHITAAHTGQASPIFGGLCSGRNLGDRIARGYITVDTVTNCTLRFPTDEGYFGIGGDATDQNVLFGDVLYTDVRSRKAVEATLVHLQADAGHPSTSTAGSYTFYGRYTGWNGSDHREPLPTNFAVRYNAATETTTDLLVWRDSKQLVTPFVCGALPTVFPLGQEEIVAFDEQENPTVIVDQPFTAEAQRVRVDGASLPVLADTGWLYLNLNLAGTAPPADPNAAQAWVSKWTDLGGRVRVGSDAIQLDNACSAKHTGVESGGAVQP